jgi:hypothetical protein
MECFRWPGTLRGAGGSIGWTKCVNTETGSHRRQAVRISCEKVCHRSHFLSLSTFPFPVLLTSPDLFISHFPLSLNPTTTFPPLSPLPSPNRPARPLFDRTFRWRRARSHTRRSNPGRLTETDPAAITLMLRIVPSSRSICRGTGEPLARRPR